MPFPPSAEPSAAFRFARNALDRRAELRDDAATIEAAWAAASARVFVLDGGRAIVRRGEDGGTSAAHDAATATALAGGATTRLFLGTADDVAWFALAANDFEEREDAPFHAVDLRSLAIEGSLPEDHYGALATARGLLHWHDGHRFCARCGAASQIVSAGWKRVCPGCGAEHFPRTDPVVIMTIERNGRCLLGRSPHFREGMWSCLAGFMEPGETIEAAVRREAREEVGVRIGRVTYFASEPWPFPGSLMIGARAEALDDELIVDPVEIAAARWFDRDEVRQLLDGGHPQGLHAPPPIAIAHHLLRRFVDGA
ncbi:MAG: NAD(+) diphosphatase [Hyphomicrobiales bacterium]|nr:NAD(+) diphosphatase [Hyphomicrobiales bacterium]